MKKLFIIGFAVLCLLFNLKSTKAICAEDFIKIYEGTSESSLTDLSSLASLIDDETIILNGINFDQTKSYRLEVLKDVTLIINETVTFTSSGGKQAMTIDHNGQNFVSIKLANKNSQLKLLDENGTPFSGTNQLVLDDETIIITEYESRYYKANFNGTNYSYDDDESFRTEEVLTNNLIIKDAYVDFDDAVVRLNGTNIQIKSPGDTGISRRANVIDGLGYFFEVDYGDGNGYESGYEAWDWVKDAVYDEDTKTYYVQLKDVSPIVADDQYTLPISLDLVMNKKYSLGYVDISFVNNDGTLSKINDDYVLSGDSVIPNYSVNSKEYINGSNSYISFRTELVLDDLTNTTFPEFKVKLTSYENKDINYRYINFSLNEYVPPMPEPGPDGNAPAPDGDGPALDPLPEPTPTPTPDIEPSNIDPRPAPNTAVK